MRINKSNLFQVLMLIVTLAVTHGIALGTGSSIPRNIAATNTPAQILTPVPGSTLSSTTVTFTWSTGAGASEYWLDIGSTFQSNDIYSQGQGTATSATIAGLPGDGSKVYVRLWSRIGTDWQVPFDYVYTASTAGEPRAQILTPAPGSTLSGTTVTFTWSRGTGVTEYWLDIGSTFQSNDIYSQGQGTTTSATIAGLPGNGSKVYVRLWSRINNDWKIPIDYSYTASTAGEPRAQILTPAPGSTLSGTTVTFTWSRGTGVTEYWLDVGSTFQSGDIYSQGQGTATSATITGLPGGGRTIYVRLWSRINNDWKLPFDYTYSSSSDPRAVMLSPTPGSTLSGSTVSFTWSTGNGVTEFWLDVGAVAGSGDIFSGGTGTSTSKTVSGIPTNGSKIYVRLWSKIGGSWRSPIEYTYSAASDLRAEILSPTPGSTLTGSTVTFTWTIGTGVTEYWLDIGTTLGGFQIFSSSQGTALSVSVSNIPIDGTIIYVRLWSRIAGAWGTGRDYTYTAASDPRAKILTPAPGSNLSGSSVVFTWSKGTGVTEYWLSVGTAYRLGDILGGSMGTVTTTTVSGIPTDGSTIFVTLWSRIGSSWQSLDYTYTAASDGRAELLSPVPGSTLAGGSVTFTWSRGTGVTEYWLDVGTALGGRQIYGASQGTALSATINNIPTDGRPLYVRLWSRIGGNWAVGRDYTYNTSADPRAKMLAPTPGSTLAGSSVTFTWSAGTNAEEYWLDIGTAPGKRDIFGGSTATATSKTVSGLPANGTTIYVRLWTKIQSNWQDPVDYSYVAAPR